MKTAVVQDRHNVGLKAWNTQYYHLHTCDWFTLISQALVTVVQHTWPVITLRTYLTRF